MTTIDPMTLGTGSQSEYWIFNPKILISAVPLAATPMLPEPFETAHRQFTSYQNINRIIYGKHYQRLILS